MSYTKTIKKMIQAADIDRMILDYRQAVYNKYYDLYCSQIRVRGFNYKYRRTFLAKGFSEGSVWVRKDDVTAEAICCGYAASTYDWNDMPVTVQLTTKNNAPATVIPTDPQVVDKDGVIVWFRKCGKGFQGDVEYCISILAECETVFRVNLALQKTPWILTSESENYAKLQALVRRIFSNEPCIITDIDKSEIDHIDLKSEWLGDRISEKKAEYENELKTLLGLDNQGGYINREQQNIDTTNSNNQEINAHQSSFVETIREGLDRANEILGLSLSIEDLEPAVQSGESKGLGESHEGAEGGDGDE